MTDTPRFFKTPAKFRAWLVKNHKSSTELVVGFWRKESGSRSITWPESVAEALCFGWIDGIRRRHNEQAYTVRFTPRRKSSKWSAINIRRVAELEAAGRMMEAGRAAFEARPHKTGAKAKGYSYEKREARLDAALVKKFKARGGSAWTFFESQPPGYRKKLAWWVMSAKQTDTRDRRLAKLIEYSATGKRLM